MFFAYSTKRQLLYVWVRGDAQSHSKQAFSQFPNILHYSRYPSFALGIASLPKIVSQMDACAVKSHRRGRVAVSRERPLRPISFIHETQHEEGRKQVVRECVIRRTVELPISVIEGARIVADFPQHIAKWLKPPDNGVAIRGKLERVDSDKIGSYLSRIIA